MLLVFGCDQAFVQGEIDVCHRHILRRPGQLPPSCVPLFRSQQSCFAQSPQDPAHHNRVCSGMLGNLCRRAHAVWVTRHMAERVQGK